MHFLVIGNSNRGLDVFLWKKPFSQHSLALTFQQKYCINTETLADF